MTLAEVARAAGVSLPTVSKVLNGRADVAAGTRARVEAVLDSQGYRRRPAGAPAPLLELVFHELDSVWSMELVRGVEAVAAEAGASVVLTRSGTRHSPGPEWLDGVLRRRPLGVVLVFGSLDAALKQRLRSRDIPFAIVDPAGDPEPDVPSVGSTNWQGGVLATQHLLDLGHRRIAVITGPADMACSVARLAGHRSALARAGLPTDLDLERFGDFHVEGGRRHALELLGRTDRPTAVFAGSDLQAIGTLDAARTLGLTVPGDVSVVGYDDVPVARWSAPALTTVHQPLEQMAAEAARIVLRQRADTSLRVELGVHLVVRASTAAPA